MFRVDQGAVQHSSHFRSAAFFFPPKLLINFPQPLPFGHPALFGRYEVVWRGAARCSAVRWPMRLTGSTAAATLFAISSATGWRKEQGALAPAPAGGYVRARYTCLSSCTPPFSNE
jgi:hypothetical protein